MQCWRPGDIPARLRYGRNPRVPAILCLGEVGWIISPGRWKVGSQHDIKRRFDAPKDIVLGDILRL